MKAPCTFESVNGKVTIDASDICKVEEEKNETNAIQTKHEKLFVTEDHTLIVIRIEKAVRDHKKAIRTEKEIRAHLKQT